MVSKNRGIYRVLCLSQVLIIMVPRNRYVSLLWQPYRQGRPASRPAPSPADRVRMIARSIPRHVVAG